MGARETDAACTMKFWSSEGAGCPLAAAYLAAEMAALWSGLSSGAVAVAAWGGRVGESQRAEKAPARATLRAAPPSTTQKHRAPASPPVTLDRHGPSTAPCGAHLLFLAGLTIRYKQQDGMERALHRPTRSTHGHTLPPAPPSPTPAPGCVLSR